MKIAVFGHGVIPSRAGGVEVVAEELSIRMAALGHQVTCYNRGGGSPDESKREQIVERGVRLRTVPTIPMKGLAAVSSSFFASLACCFSDADIVHIHGEGPGAMSILPRLFGKRVIVTVHGLDWQRAKWRRGLGAHYIRWGEKMTVRYAHEIIVLSRAMQRYFREQYHRETTYIPNGITPLSNRSPQRISDLYGLTRGGFFLFLGRLVPEKGIHYLIEAYLQLKTDKKLVIAGAPSGTADYVRDLKRLAGKNPNILFTGFVQGDVQEELYSNAAAYILPSDLEGMPLSLLEAMSCGCPCVVSDIPECTEPASGYARVFPRGNVTELAKCLQALCVDNFDVNTKTIVKDYVCNTFQWEQTVDSTLALYRQGGSHEDSAGE